MGLTAYKDEAPLSSKALEPATVKLALANEGIGAVAAVVAKGKKLRKGEMIARPVGKLAVAMHAPITGTVSSLTAGQLTMTK